VTDDVDALVDRLRREVAELHRELDEVQVRLATELLIAADPETVPWVVYVLREAARSRPALDVGDLTVAQLRALANVWSLVAKFDVVLMPSRRLVDCAKVLPTDVVARIEAILR
jgi:hypothetical protein